MVSEDLEAFVRNALKQIRSFSTAPFSGSMVLLAKTS